MKNSKLEMELRQYAKTVLFEIEFVKGLKYLERDVNRVLEYHKKDIIKEELLSTVVGLWLSGPYIVKLFGKFIGYVESMMQKYLKMGFNGDQLSKKIIEFSEKYHHVVMKAFKFVAGKFTKDPKKQEEVAEVLFYSVIGCLAASGAGHIVDAVSSSHISPDIVAKAAKTAIKAKELYDGVTQGLKAIIPDIISMIKN